MVGPWTLPGRLLNYPSVPSAHRHEGKNFAAVAAPDVRDHEHGSSWIAAIVANRNASPSLRLILKSPPLIHAEEPTSALDHINADLVAYWPNQAAHGALVLISTHSEHMARLWDRAISLDSTDSATESSQPRSTGRLDLASR